MQNSFYSSICSLFQFLRSSSSFQFSFYPKFCPKLSNGISSVANGGVFNGNMS